MKRMTVKEAIENATIYKIWFKSLGRYKYRVEYNEEFFLTGKEALNYYYDVLLPRRAAYEAKQEEQAAASGQYMLACKIGDKAKIATNGGVVEMSIREARRRIFDLEDENDKEVLWVDEAIFARYAYN